MACRDSSRAAKAAGVDGLIVVDLPPEDDEELCLPALAAGIDFIRLATPTTDDQRLPAVLRNTAGFIYYVSIAGITGTKSAAVGRGDQGGGPAEAAYRAAGGGGFRHPDTRPRRPRSPASPTRRWWARRWSRLVAQHLDEKGRAKPGLTAAVLKDVKALAKGVRQARGDRNGGRRRMNWLTNFVLPKIRAVVAKQEVPDNLWHKCPSCGQMLFHRELEANLYVCGSCGHHLRISPSMRLALLFDDGKYTIIELPKVIADPLKFRDRKRYSDRLKEAQGAKTAPDRDAAVVAHGAIGGVAAVVVRLRFLLHGRLDGHRGGRGAADGGAARRAAGGGAGGGAVLGRRAHAGGHTLADADAAHHAGGARWSRNRACPMS